VTDSRQVDFGVLDLSGPQPAVRFTLLLPHPPSKVWRALTEPEHLEEWFPTTIDGERAVGAPLVFQFHEVDIPPMEGSMVAYDPPRLLEFMWGEDRMRFELEEAPEGCLLRVSDTVVELGKAARDCAGWHVCLERLVFHLEGEEVPWDQADRWREVHPTYVERFGPGASALGPPQEWEDVHGKP
jgi:uncharacterized protein YndB with AHSA1/START domain